MICTNDKKELANVMQVVYYTVWIIKSYTIIWLVYQLKV